MDLRTQRVYRKRRNLEYYNYIYWCNRCKKLSFLATENTEVKVSYNTANERLHESLFIPKKYWFHTAYIGSSNFHVQL
jgi:hypothetical protein